MANTDVKPNVFKMRQNIHVMLLTLPYLTLQRRYVFLNHESSSPFHITQSDIGSENVS